LHFAGNTEQAFLNNFDDIVESSLPVQKVMDLFPDKETAEDSILGKISYCEERIKVHLMHLIFINLYYHVFSASCLINITYYRHKIVFMDVI